MAGVVTANHEVIGSSDMSVDAAAKKAEELGFHTEVFTYTLTGEARHAGNLLVDAWEKCSLPLPFILFAGGETTVQVKGNGLGGRNLEVALGIVKRISKLERIALITLATDGEDGPTDAAGALVTPETLSQAGSNEGFLEQCLETNDSYRFFEKSGSLIKTGSTGTNVNDISLVIGY
jgi:glycerate-2-kinase